MSFTFDFPRAFFKRFSLEGDLSQTGRPDRLAARPVRLRPGPVLHRFSVTVCYCLSLVCRLINQPYDVWDQPA